MSIYITIALIFVVFVVVVVAIMIRQIEQYEAGVLFQMGKFKKDLNPGWNIVYPWITKLVKVDLRTQVLDVPRQEVITKDNSPTIVDAVVYFKVQDAKSAILKVTNYRMAIVNMAQTTLRAVIGDMELDEVLSNRDRINVQLRNLLDEATDPWGVLVENVEIREVDPSPNVKHAMEEQTSAERERRAAILRADGEKRAAILSAEGAKQARILEAEGVRQSKVLEAQGERTRLILERQGEAQGLRILSVGSAPMDSKALTVLSLNALRELGQGAATKLVLPFELTKLIEGAADYIGYSRKVPDRELSQVSEIEKAVGDSDDILGTIPTVNEMKAEMDAIKEEVQAATQIEKASTALPDELEQVPEA